MGKGSKQPAAPDPYKTASAEAQFNRQDTYGPGGGGVVHGYTDAGGNFVQGMAPKGFQSAQKTVESPTERQLRLALEPASVALTNRVITDNIAGMPDAARVKDRGTVAQSIYDRTFSMMKPAIDQGNDRLLTNLQARGIPIGSKAFNDTYGAQQRETQDTISRLAMDADVAAGGEQSRLFSLDSAQRSNAIAELVAAMGGGYAAPTNNPSGAAAGVNYSGLVGDKYKADMASWQNKQNQSSATAGMLGNLGAAMIMAPMTGGASFLGKSDRRLKADIRQVGWRGPFRLYEFRYLWDRPGTVRRGYMAQEVLKIIPAAVHRVRWWLEVDYAMLPEVH